MRLWIEEATDSLIPIVGLDANARVPFSWNWAQVLLMAAFAALLIAFSPRSRLWLMPLDTGSRLQRGAFTIGALALAGYTAVQIYWQIAGAAPMAYHTPGRYSYDYDQYDHVAQALMNGHAWLDLPVPEQFAQLHNPYDTAARDHLLEQGVTHIYWDYAYHDGHWYSYFGVLPALLLFLPYRAITSLFVPGGLMLPNASADMLLMLGAAIFGCLLVIRLLKRMPVQVSVATCALSCLAFMLGSNLLYFWHRTNFYSIPFASGLCLTFPECGFGLAPLSRENAHARWGVPIPRMTPLTEPSACGIRRAVHRRYRRLSPHLRIDGIACHCPVLPAGARGVQRIHMEGTCHAHSGVAFPVRAHHACHAHRDSGDCL